MFRSLPYMILALACLAGCHNPARQRFPEVTHAQREEALRRELVPGRKADWALAYLFEAGFDCQMTRNEQGQIEAISATLPKAVRDASGEKWNRRILLVIRDDHIQSVDILSYPKLR